MKYFIIVITIFTFISGCSYLDKKTETINPGNELELINSNKINQSEKILNKKLGVYDKDSLFAYPVFRGTEESEDDKYISPFQSRVYRNIDPWNGENDVFNDLYLSLKTHRYDISIGDILVSYLLSEESINISDEELYKKISPFTEIYVFSKYTDTYNYRLIGLNEDSSNTEWAYWHYFIQVWNKNNIWAQPLFEGAEFKFDEVVFAISNVNQLVLLSGRAERSGGSSFAVAGTGFSFENGIWKPIKWNELYEEVSLPENLDIKSDGIRMVYIDPYMAKAFNLPFHEGPLYKFNISENGSFWADFSSFPLNKDMPKKLLFYRY